MPYALIDHTADFGIRVEARGLEALFREAAEALFDQIIDRRGLAGDRRTHLSVTGLDLSDLMVNWLRETLYLWNGRSLLIKAAEIRSISPTNLTAVVFSDPYDPLKHTIITEIKAVTYHQIRVSESPSGCQAQIIFDV